MLEHRPVYRLVNRPLVVANIERKLFFGSFGFGAVLFEATANLLAALAVTALLLFLARIQTAADPKLINLLRRARSLKPIYDPFLINHKHLGPQRRSR